AGDDNAVSAQGEFVTDFAQSGVKKLGFIDANDIDILSDRQHLPAVSYCPGSNGAGIVTHDFVDTVSRIAHRFKNLDRLSGNPGAPETADQLLGLTRKHGAANHFQPASPGRCENRFVKHAGGKYAASPETIGVANGIRNTIFRRMILLIGAGHRTLHDEKCIYGPSESPAADPPHPDPSRPGANPVQTGE